MPDTPRDLVMLSNALDILGELRDRARRTETRLTRFIEQQGHDTRVTRPRFIPTTCTVLLPSPECSLREALECIPADYKGSGIAISVVVGTDTLCTIDLPA